MCDLINNEVFRRAWNDLYDKAVRSFRKYSAEVPPPDLTDPSDPAVVDFVSRLMLSAYFEYSMQRGQSGGPALDSTWTPSPLKKQTATDRLITVKEEDMTTICQDFSNLSSPSKILKVSPPGSITPERKTVFDTSSESEKSPSLLTSHNSRREQAKVRKLVFSPDRAAIKSQEKENNSMSRLMPPPKVPANNSNKKPESGSGWINASKAKSSKGSSKGVFKSKSFEAVPINKLSSRSKRLVQTTLDTSAFAEKPKQEDLSASKEFLGGFRSQEDDDFSISRPKRKTRGAAVEVVHKVKAEPVSPPLFSTPTVTPEKPTKKQCQDNNNDVTPDNMDVTDFEETYYQPSSPIIGPQREGRGRNIPVGNDTMDVIDAFNKFPRDNTPSPTFRYKPDAIRKKADRDKLAGVTCDLCKEYYKDLESQLNDKQIADILNKCSKHKEKYAARDYATPPDFWRTDFPSTEECKITGLIQIEPRDPKADPNRRHRICD